MTGPFKVGGVYENSAGTYLVLAIDGEEVTLHYLSGDVAGATGRLDVHRLTQDWNAIRSRLQFQHDVPAVPPVEQSTQSETKHSHAADSLTVLPLPGVYHLTHVSNIESILKEGLHCKNRLNPNRYVDIAEPGVQDLRNRITIILRCPDGPRRHGTVHDFVPLFFNPVGPMLYARQDRARNIVILEIAQAILTEPLVLFSDGNVAMQQLYKRPGHEVEIVVSCDGSPCRRQHQQHRRDSTGSPQPASNIYHGLEHLPLLPWDTIGASYWKTRDDGSRNPDGGRQRAAEVLVAGSVSPAAFRRIIVGYPDTKRNVEMKLREIGVELLVEMDRRFRWPASASM